MKLIVLISILTLIRAEEHHGDYVINGVPHYKETLFTDLSSNYNRHHFNLVVDYATNELYFLDWYSEEDAVYNIDTDEFNYMTGIWRPQCVTLDQDNHIIYVGTSDGIYKYNGTAQTDLVGAKGDSVWKIYYYNGVIYYRKNSNAREIRTLVNGRSETYHEFKFQVNNFVVDNEENVVCRSNNGNLYKLKKDTKQNVLYDGIPYVQSVTTDRNGTVYFSVDDGIYKVKGDGVEKIVNIDNPRYMAFDRDNNIIYYNNKELKIYRLKPVNVTHSGSGPHNN